MQCSIVHVGFSRIHPWISVCRWMLLGSVLGAAPWKTEAVAASFPARPKLIVTIVIDQFRADYLLRFQSKFLPAHLPQQRIGGFKYLMEESAYFPYGEYGHAQCITGPGHATILSGAFPYQSGIVLNSWFNASTQSMEECTEDASYPIVGLTHPTGTDLPLRELKKGASPRLMIAPTLGDELKNEGHPSKVVSVALKERAAVLMGGHRADLALWFDPLANQWISSTYYLPQEELPPWVRELNAPLRSEVGQLKTWNRVETPSVLSSIPSFALEDKTNAGLLGGVKFPHQTTVGTPGMLAMPYGVTRTREAALGAMKQYQLGRHAAPDLLAVSFSSHDLVGHAFGPNSLEAEEITLFEDREISELLNGVRQFVPGGLDQVLIVLTGDHGAAPSPEWASHHQMDAGRMNEADLGPVLEMQLTRRWGTPPERTEGARTSMTGGWIRGIVAGNVYLNLDALQAKSLDRGLVEASIKRFLQTDVLWKDKFAQIVTATEAEQKIFPPGLFARQVERGYYPGRSGNLLLIPRPYVISGSADGPSANHTTGYAYDRTVPIVIAGPHIKKGIYAQGAQVVDIAPTLAFLTQILPPASSEGRVLHEILGAPYGPNLEIAHDRGRSTQRTIQKNSR